MNRRSHQTQAGFTLIEMIISLVIFAMAMVVLSRFLFPQIALSAEPHYQARAAALANAMMNEILARKFDANSDDNGEQIRCDDTQDLQGGAIDNPCAITLVANTIQQQLTTVDDYIGCWQGKSAHCQDGNGRPLSNALGNSIAADYSHFSVTVAIFYDNNLTNNSNPTTAVTPHNYKRINMVVDSGRYGRYSLSAYRGNY
ncbi:prepilin-type N-terminal cleavage/methylation domain-containing protein [Photobacterium aquimaris]|uniref:Prepilin-type N-terminal cleavage/methylation domain-containing protein n=1 Tax=Photobacterium aquimaris TaxID=512643 RepID=A0A2T3I133_9GAMM|nr:prepilin-type N-terminal cleavage/methylation domain-containing protein [Photobacterium aquimaris]MCP4957279.1 prepilin-type N-terminal cleavage/methylation domain-containing protein [Photobacterium aquimaris]OBU26179.1 hypothetical protein AYY21_07720 [Photobacterium aquimaris]PQJ42060.1 hypothetical protein BTN98_10925 [Photobacterium aquimaris]PSU10244.1 prepilin-type N-terminal cleavage/methylation domain-containing protein [Photobacterium aquimaris]